MTFEQMAEILRLDARMRRIEVELRISDVEKWTCRKAERAEYIDVPTLVDLASEAREKFKEHTCPAFGLGCLDMTAAQISQCALQPGPEGKCVMKGNG